MLSNVDLSATMESRICIVGENGAGKFFFSIFITGVYKVHYSPWLGGELNQVSLGVGKKI